MINHWLLIALVLLLLPVGLFLPASVPLAGYERGCKSTGWCLFVLILDPFRAGFGAWCLVRGFGPLVERIGYNSIGEALIIGSVFVVGVLIQTFSRYDEDYVFAPFGYAAGALLFFCGPTIALPAIVLGLGSAAAIRAWTPFFFVAGFFMMIMGPIAAPDAWQPALALGLGCMLPPLTAVMAGRHMGFPRIPTR